MARIPWNSLVRRLRPAGDDPVFVFAAAWRTGSTLLQRIVCASRTVFVWGEPRFLPEAIVLYNRMMEVQQRAQRSAGIFEGYVPGTWIPTLFPDRDRVRESFRLFFRKLYFEPVHAHGYRRWGFKEVRPDAVEAARFLHTLFPAGKFVFMVRNPLDTYLSIKNKPFFSEFQDPLAPVIHWHRNAAAFREVVDSGALPAILVRYEDLVADRASMVATIERVASHIGVPVSLEMLNEVSMKVGGAHYEKPLTGEERQAILTTTGAVAMQLGYKLSGSG